MKKLLLTAAILATLTTYGQTTFSGIVAYNTSQSPTNARVFVSSNPLGGGVLAAGTSYNTALFWGAAGTTDPNAMTQIGVNVAFLTGSVAGTFIGGNRTITYTSPAQYGAVVALQSRAWAVEPGVTGWNSARYKGAGPIFDLKLKDTTIPSEPLPNIWMAPEWRSYTVIIPEPSTIALGLLGAGALLMLRWRR